MRYQINEYLLDTDTFELQKDGLTVHAEPQVIELLMFLVENNDRMVSKDEINEKIWHGRIVSESALSSRIKMARHLFGDNGRDQNVIRTIHKKGFRFIAPVEIIGLSNSLKGSEQNKSNTDSEIEDSQNEPPRKLNHKNAKPAIAVLPFINRSSDAEQEYFSDGITSDIITYLSKHRWLDVTARNSTFGYKGQTVNIKKLGQELLVDYIVEGSVQRSGNRIRITTSLIDAHTGLNIWGERYDREISDIFALQDEITEIIVARLEPEIGFSERNRVFLSRPSNLQAWDCYHLGIYHFFKFTAEDNLEAQSLLQKSYQLDSNFGEAYAWWAYSLILGMVYWKTPSTQDLLDQALEACNHALSLDGQNATFYALRGRVLLARREYSSAVRDNEKAIALNPSFAAAHCGLGDSLAYEGRYKEAEARFEKAVNLSPNDPQLWAFLTYGALNLIFKEDFETALRWIEKAEVIPNCQYWTTAHRVVALSCLNRDNEARVAVKRLLKENPEFSLKLAREKLFYLKKQEQIDLYINGLRRAGIAEG